MHADARLGALDGRPRLSCHPRASFDHEGALWVWTSPLQREPLDPMESSAESNELWRLDNTSLTWFRVWVSDSIRCDPGPSITHRPTESSAERSAQTYQFDTGSGKSLRCHDRHPVRTSHYETQSEVYRPNVLYDSCPPSSSQGQTDPSLYTQLHMTGEQRVTPPESKNGTQGVDDDELDELGLDLGLSTYGESGNTLPPCGLSLLRPKTAESMPVRTAPHFFCISGVSGTSEMVFVGGVDPSQNRDTSPTTSAWRDTWHLELKFPSWQDNLQRARLLVRQQQFTELLLDAGASVAMDFLQSSIAGLLDHCSEHDTRLLCSLTSQLLDPSPTPSPSDSSRSHDRLTSMGMSSDPHRNRDDELVNGQERTIDDRGGLQAQRGPSTTSPRPTTSDRPLRTRQLEICDQRVRAFRALLPLFPLQAVEPSQELVDSIAH